MRATRKILIEVVMPPEASEIKPILRPMKITKADTMIAKSN